MRVLKKAAGYFTPAEKLLWGASVGLLLASYGAFGGQGAANLAASLVGVTSLIFCAKGNPFGQALMILFSTMYGMISLGFAYYGEFLTYVGMTLPMAVLSLVSWLKNPYEGQRSQVKVGHVGKKEGVFAALLTAAVTAVFYQLLAALGTANLLPSTLSVATSFFAAYLTFRRDARLCLAYGANDVVLVVLWVMAALEDKGYISVAVCFAVFLANDLYGYYSWRRMEKRQAAG